MKKFIFTLLLAIVSSVWTTSMALCLSPIPDAVYQPFATVSGTFVSVPIPCEPIDEYPCPACLTLALQTSDRLYYLTADNADIQTQLEAIEYQLSLTTNITGSVSGTPYTEESYEYIRVQAVDTNSAPLRLPSICDEWNVLQFRSHMGYSPDEYYTQHYRLTSDTVINGQIFRKLYKENSYSGAMREGTNRDIYYVPADSTHEYLLYAFNAQVGDTLTNVWFGTILHYEAHSIKTATIMEIKPTSPKTFVIDVEYWLPNMMDTLHKQKEWIEGVGMNAPDGGLFEPLAGGFSSILLCAYKNREQVYVSEWGEQHGCEYNQTPLLPSLCDEWNVWYESFQSFGPINYNAVIKYRLATDTMINGQRYVQLAYDNSPYMEGVLREGSNRDIYYIPSRSTHEYLLYAFNAQVGDTITNLYVGAMGKEEGYQAVVRAISDSNPRIFTVGVNIDEYTEYPIKWIEGVGSPETPYGLAVVPTVPADPGVYSLLCAYKNGEQVYVSEWGEQYGCVYREDFIEGEFVTLYGNIVASFRECSIDGCPRCFGSFMTQDASIYSLTATDTLIMEQLNMLYLGKQYTIKGVWTKCKFIEVNAIYETKDTIPSDTIPLYIKDGPGSSTVEPVDPNEIIAKLILDELQMKEYLHTIIDYNLTKAPTANSSPAVKHVNPVVAADSFTDSETVTLTESGRYFLEMSHPDWDYTIVGTFVYNARQGLETIENSQSACTKELREGQLLIRQGEQLYTPTGIRIQ